MAWTSPPAETGSEAITKNDVLILILSEAALASDWVRWEVASARAVEEELSKDMFCPVSIDDSWRTWSDDPVLRREIVKYHVVEFVHWRDDEAFEQSYCRLVHGLRENYLETTVG